MVLRAEPSPSAEQRLRALLDARAPLGPRRRLGIEHEYAVFDGDRQLDFRQHVHHLGFPGRVLHPTNHDAILTPSGVAVMADGWVAEAATPPEELRPGAARLAERSAQWGRQLIERHLPAAYRLEPGSTHLSVETHSSRTDQLCLWFAQTFAPALMLLMDRVDSPGVLVRPRPRRFEVGGEFVSGERLSAALTFLAGSVIALESARHLPPAVEVAVEPARRRYGWYVDRQAFGSDLYAGGRQTTLHLRGGGETTAQAQLEACWQVAREALGDLATPEELAAVERLVSGATPLPCEDAGWDRRVDVEAPPPNVFGRLEARGSELAVQPVSATWDYVAFEVRQGAASAAGVVVSVPYAYLGAFIDAVEDGVLDEVLGDAIAESPTSVLTSHAQTGEVGVHGGIQPSDALLPRDRVGVGPGAVSTVRPGKVEEPPPPPPVTQPPRTQPPSPPAIAVGGGFPRWVIVPLVSLILTLFGGGLFLFSRDDADPTPTPTPAETTSASTGTATAMAMTADATGVAVPPPVVGPIVAELVVPVTTYRVEASSPGGLPLTYRWFLETTPGQDCGTRVPATSEPTDSSVATWSHENAPSDDNCHHDAPDHPFHIRVEVSDGVNPPVIRTYEGSESGVGSAE